VPLNEEIAEYNEEGEPLKTTKGKKYAVQKNYALCRCGKSKNKPFCDGSHLKTGFKGTETASKKKYLEEAETTEGPELNLTDVPHLCAGAGFCHRAGGTWNLTLNSDDPEAKKIAIQEAGCCYSGRLTAWDKKTGKAIEPKLKPAIGIIKEGPILVKGGVPIESADGSQYEVKNRVSLCRCGKSKNKPFCDGSHFWDGSHIGDGE